MKEVNVALFGIGTVGSGTFDVLFRNAEEISRRAGCHIQITTVVDINTTVAEKIVAGRARVTNDAMSVINDPTVDIVIELIGGYGIAKTLVLAAINAGKHVVTANKAMLAVHGNELFAAARAKNVVVAYEAAVAGGIPIIKSLREGLAANKVEWIAGIINGTCNFILSEMRSKGLAFADVLKEAQAKGYAEADPTFDIEGIDAGHKISILAAIGFGIPLSFPKAHVEGISNLAAEDIKNAEELGYSIKLLGIAKRVEQGFELRVHPTLIPAKRLIANVEGVMNAVLVKGDAVGATMYYGAGAGSEPTASAVIADLVDVARAMHIPVAQRVPVLGYQDNAVQAAHIVPLSQVQSAYYLRLRVADKPGVLADITRRFADNHISIEALRQREPAEGEEQADIILLTNVCQEAQIDAAISAIANLPTTLAPIVKLRVDNLA